MYGYEKSQTCYVKLDCGFRPGIVASTGFDCERPFPILGQFLIGHLRVVLHPEVVGSYPGPNLITVGSQPIHELFARFGKSVSVV